MFTGIIEKKGTVVSNLIHDGGNRLVVSATFAELQIGESIAVNGVCLTLLPADKPRNVANAMEIPENLLSFDISPETLDKTTLAELVPGEQVNLERAMFASARFGGHYVSGHVDAIATIQSMKQLNEFTEIELGGFSESETLYLIPKGSITVEGVSLTINSLVHRSVKLMLVPHTLISTTLGLLKTEQKVNIEFDYLTRIVAHQLQIAGNLNDKNLL